MGPDYSRIERSRRYVRPFHIRRPHRKVWCLQEIIFSIQDGVDIQEGAVETLSTTYHCGWETWVVEKVKDLEILEIFRGDGLGR